MPAPARFDDDETDLQRDERVVLRQLFEHHPDGYQPLGSSGVLPQLDLELVVRCMSIPSQHAAVKTLREVLRGRR